MEILQGPAPAPQRAGSLLAAANTPTAVLDRNTESGYRAAACSGWGVYDPCGTDVVDHGRDDQGDVVSGTPFGVVSGETCSTFGFTQADYETRARDRLAEVESAAIARELWTGELATLAAGGDPDSAWADNPRLAAGAAVTDLTPGAGALSPVAGLALLERELGELLAGSAGAIHATRDLVTLLARPAGLRREGDLILTMFDTRVIGDAGYPGTSPTNTASAAGETWIYGTARPTIRRSAVAVTPTSLGDALNRSTNQVTYSADRLALALFPCGVLAVRVTLTEGA